MMKKLLLTLTGTVLLVNIQNAQQQMPELRPGSNIKYLNSSVAPQNNLVANLGDTLLYYYLKNTYLNANTGNPVPANQYWTIKQHRNTTNPSHVGSIFLNSSPIQITGLMGMVMREPTSTSTAVPVTFYLCNVNNLNQVSFPPLDSVTSQVATTTGGVFVGGSFSTAVSVNGRFAVLMKNTSALNTDTIRLFMNNGATPTSTAPANQKYGENLSVRRANGAFQTNTGAYGAGTDFEWVVVPFITFNFDSDVTVQTPSICTNGMGTFSNSSTPMDIIDNRQFNFNKFYQRWGQHAINTLSSTAITQTQPDSIFNWTFTGSSVTQSFLKHPSIIFNTPGSQNASLDVRYRKSGDPTGNSISDIEIATISVDPANAPIITVTGNTLLCSGNTTTLTASGSTSFTWTSPASNNAAIQVTPPVGKTTYTVHGLGTGCVGSQTVTVQVSLPPTLQITSNASVCAGSSFSMGATGATNYTWSTNSNNPVIITSNTVAGIAEYTVNGTTPGCAPAMATRTIEVIAKPEVTLFADFDRFCDPLTTVAPTTYTLIGSPDNTGGTGNGRFTVINNPTGSVSNAGVFTPKKPGTLTATYTYTDNTTGCSADAKLALVIEVCTGVEKNKQNSELSVYPNPATNGKVIFKNLEGVNVISVYNLLGGLVAKEVVNFSEFTLDLSSQAEGTYFVRVTASDGGVNTVKIVNRK